MIVLPRSVWRLLQRSRQQQTVAELSLEALESTSSDGVFRSAVATVATSLGVEYANVLELRDGGRTVVLRAGFGWNRSSTGRSAVLDPDSAAGLALRHGAPVLVRYRDGVHRHPFLVEHDVRTAAATVIWGGGKPFGVLAAYSRRGRAFGRGDLHFLRAVANVLASAIVHERSLDSTRQLAAIVESSLDAIVGRTPDGIVTSWNRAAEDLFGYSADEMIGRRIDILAPPDRGHELGVINEQLSRGVTVHAFETVRVRKDGTLLDVSSTVSPIRDAEGRTVAASAISRDITAWKRQEAALTASEARARAVLESALDAVVTIDHRGRIVEFNPAAEKMFGFERAAVLGREMADLLVPPALRAEHRRGLEHLLATGEGPILGQRLELTAVRADGSEFPVELSVTQVALDGAPAFTGYIRDIGERRRAEEQLRRSEERYRGLFENASEPIATVDLDGNLTRVNAAFEIALGYTRDELIGTNLDRYLTVESAHTVRAHRRARVAGEEVVSKYELTFVGRGGRLVVLEVSARMIEEDGRPVGFQGTCRDVTARKESEAELRRLADLNRHQALHDQLTGLPNRLHLQERIEEALEASDGGALGFALLVVNLDRFREINESLGHRSGDAVLREVAARLTRATRPDDTIARLSGDEFGILLPGVGRRAPGRSDGPPGWAPRVEQLRAALEQPVFVQGIPVGVEASIGIALHPEHGDDAEVLLRRADVAMDVAKHEGRGHVLYSPREDRGDASRLTLLGELRTAIDLGELALDYQPTLELATGRVPRVEALVRWHHPTSGLIPPHEFVSVAERTALITPLTRLVLEQAVRQCMQWERAGQTLAIAVNLSPRNLGEPDLVDDVARTLRTWQLDPSRLLLEITESAIMADPARTEAVLRALSDLGIRIALDDFGAGYTSLAHIANLPLDQVKIDRSFVSRLLTDGHAAAIVNAIVHLCRDLGLQVVAEGVEDAATLAELRRLQCSLVQGYYLSRPLAPDDLLRWLEERPGRSDLAA